MSLNLVINMHIMQHKGIDNPKWNECFFLYIIIIIIIILISQFPREIV